MHKLLKRKMEKDMNFDYESLAIANVKWQKFDKTYDPEIAIKKGTIFPELDKPFIGTGKIKGEKMEWKR